MRISSISVAFIYLFGQINTMSNNINLDEQFQNRISRVKDYCENFYNFIFEYKKKKCPTTP